MKTFYKEYISPNLHHLKVMKNFYWAKLTLILSRVIENCGKNEGSGLRKTNYIQMK